MAESVQLDKKKRFLGGKIGTSGLGGADKLSDTEADWLEIDPDTISYLSATSFSVTFDATEKFTFGDRLRWEQTTERFAFVTGVTSDAVTIFAGTDFSVANESITRFRLSKVVNPVGFPLSFEFDLGVSGDARVDYSQSECFIIGSWCYVQLFLFSTLGFLSVSSYDLSLPLPANVWMNASGSFTPSLAYAGFSTGHGISTAYDLRFDILAEDNETLTISDPGGDTLASLAETGLSFMYPLYIS